MFVKADLRYLDQILKIEKNIFKKPWSEVHFLKDLKLDVSFNIVCIEKTKCIGYIFGYIINKEYHLNNIAIQKSYQNKGFGNKLLNFLIKKLKNKKIKKIFLEVQCDNISAIKLYESNNFKKVNIRKNYYKKGKDAFLYNLDIN